MAPVSKAKFEKAVEIIQNLPKDGPIKPSQEEQLSFYKYYKQATVGDVNIPRPGMLDFTGKAKWDAWNGVKSCTVEECYKQYVEMLTEVLKRAEEDEMARKALAELEAA